MNPQYAPAAPAAPAAPDPAPTVPAAPDPAPAVPAAPDPAPAPAPAAPAAPAAAAPAPTVREFGNGLAAHKEQDDTVYRTLGRMNVACSHCGALHWIEVLICTYYNGICNFSTSSHYTEIVILIPIQLFLPKI